MRISDWSSDVCSSDLGVEQLLLRLGLAPYLARHREEVDEHRDLGLEDHGLDWLEHIVDRAHRIAADQMLGFLVDGREEDDWDALRLLAVADDLGGFVAVHSRDRKSTRLNSSH